VNICDSAAVLKRETALDFLRGKLQKFDRQQSE